MSKIIGRKYVLVNLSPMNLIVLKVKVKYKYRTLPDYDVIFLLHFVLWLMKTYLLVMLVIYCENW